LSYRKHSLFYDIKKHDFYYLGLL
ncbi:hypothetical protein EC960932_4981, partial [Escherichia coli 96.0932]